jgi:hypothetical protein
MRRTRLLLALLAVASSGCRSAEFAVDHQMTGLHVVAKFEAVDRSATLAHLNSGDPRVRY